MVSEPLVLLAAGGTGGHLFPAEALAAELGRRGVAVELVTDPRAREYAHDFPARRIHSVASATFDTFRDEVDWLAETVIARNAAGVVAIELSTAAHRRLGLAELRMGVGEAGQEQAGHGQEQRHTGGAQGVVHHGPPGQ